MWQNKNAWEKNMNVNRQESKLSQEWQEKEKEVCG